ncbi:MAG TPA: AraC family transcriptional regulator ligand-binding domain-containing protein, partial [Ottowia sp.]|nr:AraC family transcriptional regulator ligand-binding domain-containing protein [Ottowia sp.]
MTTPPTPDRLPRPAGQTPISLVRAVLLAYAQRHLDPSAALRKAQITPSDLGQSHGHVTALQFERLCSAAMQELDDEAPGWFSRRLPWGSYGMLARA